MKDSQNASASPASKLGMIALVIAALTTVFVCVAVAATPSIVRSAMSGGIYDHIYAVPLIMAGVTTALNCVALAAGVVALRRPAGRAVAGAAVALSLSGIVGILIYIVATFFVIPRVM